MTQKEKSILREAEASLGVNLIDSYESLPKAKRKAFLANAEYYNKCHAEYLESEGRVKKRYEEFRRQYD